MKTVREAAHALCDRWDMMQWKDAEHTSVFVRALRRALAQPEPVMDYDKEELRNTVWDTNKQSLAQPEPEPAMLDRAYTERLIAALEDNSDPVSIDAAEEFRRLLTSPKREWVGLTDEEVQAMDSGVNSISSFYAGALWANEKLKEKNT